MVALQRAAIFISRSSVSVAVLAVAVDTVAIVNESLLQFPPDCSHLGHFRPGQPTSEVITRADGGILQRPPLIAVSTLADILQACSHTGTKS